MLVYAADKKQFMYDCNVRDIEDVMWERFKSVTGKSVSKQEVQSWKSSLNYVAKVLADDDIDPNIGVAVEMHLPSSSKRIDVTLSGYDVQRKKSVVVIELKQWERVTRTAKDGVVRTYLGKGEHETVHPSYQAWSYASLLEGFNEAVYEGGIQVQPCAYLHNYVRDGQIDHDHYSPYIKRAPLFLKGAEDRKRLSEFIKHHVRYGDQRDVLYELENGRIRPSKALADALTGLMKGNPEFVLIDEQKEVFEAALAAAQTATDIHPKVVLIEGGPGTGKTVLAINLLVRLTSLGLTGQYVSKNAAPREVYQARLTGSMTKTRFSNLFSGSGRFHDDGGQKPPRVDFLIVDEAHRLNEKSGLYSNLGENQIKEIIRAGNCCIFFLDEDQRVTLSDIGSCDAIENFAKARGASLERYTLASQFRCSGSDGYLAWLDDVLGIRETANSTFSTSDYDFQVFDSPQALHAAIEARNHNNRARVVAGYCWPWNSKKDAKAHDIVIGEYRRQWNLNDDGSLWIMAADSVAQVGCIHTCQGLEVDYVGVIIGNDFKVRDGLIVTDPKARDRYDKTLRGHKRRAKSDPAGTKYLTDLLIKNTYRTLMTRGMKGCYVYCVDPETAEYFRSRLAN